MGLKSKKMLLLIAMFLMVILSACSKSSGFPAKRLLNELQSAVNEGNDSFFVENLYTEKSGLTGEDVVEIVLHTFFDVPRNDVSDFFAQHIVEDNKSGFWEKLYSLISDKNDIQISIYDYDILANERERDSHVRRWVILKVYMNVQYSGKVVQKERYLKYLQLRGENKWRFQPIDEADITSSPNATVESAEELTEQAELNVENLIPEPEYSEPIFEEKEITTKFFVDNTESMKGFVNGDVSFQKVMNQIELVIDSLGSKVVYTLQDTTGNTTVYSSVEEMKDLGEFLKWREYKSPIAAKLKSGNGEGFYTQADFENDYVNPISLLVDQSQELNLFEESSVLFFISDLHDQGYGLSGWGESIRSGFLKEIANEKNFGAAIFVLELPFEGISWINDPSGDYKNELQEEFKNGEKRPISILLAGDAVGVRNEIKELERVLEEGAVQFYKIDNLCPETITDFQYSMAKSIAQPDIRDIRKNHKVEMDDIVQHYCLRLIEVDNKKELPQADLYLEYQDMNIDKNHKKDISWIAYYPIESSFNSGLNSNLTNVIGVHVYHKVGEELKELSTVEWSALFKVNLQEQVKRGIYLGKENTRFVDLEGYATQDLGQIIIEVLDKKMIQREVYYFEFDYEMVSGKNISYPPNWVKMLDFDLSNAVVADNQKVWHKKIFNLDKYIRSVMGMKLSSSELSCNTVTNGSFRIAIINNKK